MTIEIHLGWVEILIAILFFTLGWYRGRRTVEHEGYGEVDEQA